MAKKRKRKKRAKVTLKVCMRRLRAARKIRRSRRRRSTKRHIRRPKRHVRRAKRHVRRAKRHVRRRRAPRRRAPRRSSHARRRRVPFFSGPGSRKKQAQAIAEVKTLAERVIAKQPTAAFGYGFLWGVVGGKKVLIASIDGRSNHSLIQRVVEKHPAVEYTWVNLD